MSSDLELFDYLFIDNNAEKTLFLLHGTGGSKSDFLFLDEALGKRYNLVGLAGNIDEQGMRRFFKRIAVGVFDQESVRIETEKLYRFFAYWIKEHHIKNDNLYAFGYSNGANILLAMMFMYPQIVKHFVLLHAMLPFPIEKGTLELSYTDIFLSLGAYDEMVSEEAQQALTRVLSESGARVEMKRYARGHELHREEFRDVIEYLM